MHLLLRRSSSILPKNNHLFLGRVAFKSSVTVEAPPTGPELKEVPSLPFVGSLWYSYSKIPEMKQSKIFDFWPEMRRQYGAFYSIGIPGLGAGLTGTCYVIQDPVEMAKIVRKEGKFPAGAAEFAWPLKKYFEDREMSVGALLGRGETWKRMRSFVQSDLLHPDSAARYMPAVVEAAQSSSRGASEHANRLNEYLNLASFEMFSNVMLGEITHVTDPGMETHPEDEQFCRSVASALRINSELMRDASSAVLALKLGYRTPKYKEMEEEWDIAQNISRAKVAELYEKRQNGTLTETQKNCYAVTAFERQEQGDNDFTVDEVKMIVGGLLAAGVDTTGGFLSWKLLHLALSETAQERVHAELQACMNKHESTKLTPECITRKEAPYLYAALRESHRLANVGAISPMKFIPNEVTVHDVDLPADSVILLDGYSTGLREDLVGDEPLEFDPSRFLPEAVAARKGTDKAVLDHPFFAGPFSQGARKCPGSRVANLESIALLAQLILDYKITVPGVNHWTEVPYDQETLTTVQLPRMEFTPRSS